MVDAFSLKLQRDNRKNALAVDPAKGKNWKKGCIFHRTVELKQPHTITEPINILKTICFSLSFFSGGLHDWGILLVLSLELQENINRFLRHSQFLPSTSFQPIKQQLFTATKPISVNGTDGGRI